MIKQQKNSLTVGVLIAGALMALAGLYDGLNSWLYAGIILSVIMLVIILLRNIKREKRNRI